MAFDTGDTAFMIISASLVMLMTPGLAFFYGGLVSRSGVLTIMIQSFVSLAVTDIIWFCVGYTLSFGESQGGIIGNLDKAFLIGVTPDTPFSGNPNIPEYVFFCYQMMFAIITPALITGAFTNRVRFRAYLIFLVAWIIIVYVPWVHWIWGGGFISEWGVLDFAGGIVVHATAGMGALASVFFVGARTDRTNEPHSIPLVALGTGLLWFGWYGFNAGSQLGVDGITALAFINTDLSASFAAVTWLIVEWATSHQPKFLGLLTGAVAGLATITPAAGFVPVWASVIFGILAGLACFLAVYLKNKWGWDDALDVWGVHGVGGILGTVLLGLFASKDTNPNGANGLFFGDASFFFKELMAVVFAGFWGFIWTYLLLLFIDKFLTPVRVSDVDQDRIDEIEMGEHAYYKKAVTGDALDGIGPNPRVSVNPIFSAGSQSRMSNGTSSPQSNPAP